LNDWKQEMSYRITGRNLYALVKHIFNNVQKIDTGHEPTDNVSTNVVVNKYKYSMSWLSLVTYFIDCNKNPLMHRSINFQCFGTV
jgi:hypothetical protein